MALQEQEKIALQESENLRQNQMEADKNLAKSLDEHNDNNDVDHEHDEEAVADLPLLEEMTVDQLKKELVKCRWFDKGGKKIDLQSSLAKARRETISDQKRRLQAEETR